MKNLKILFSFFWTLLIISCNNEMIINKSQANIPIIKDSVYYIKFAGEEWIVKDKLVKKAGPGPNFFDHKNIWVDENGQLHLKLSKRSDNTWACAEIYSKRLFGDGIYQFNLEGRPDLFDENIVLGFFNYPCIGNSCEPDGTHEIDIEFTKWGKKLNPFNLHYNTFPSKIGGDSYSKSLKIDLKNNISIHRISRKSTNVKFDSFYPYKASGEEIIGYGNSESKASKLSMPIHINLWLFLGKAPNNGKEVEIIIKDFKFRAL